MVEFDATLAELVDVQLRLIRRSHVARTSRRRSLLIVGLAAAIVAFLAFDFSFPLPLRVFLSAIIGSAAGGLYASAYTGLLRRRCRRYLAEQLGGATVAHCEIEPRPEALFVRQNELEMTFDWEGAESVEESQGDIVIAFRQGVVVVHSRGFKVPEDRDAFLQDARARADRRASVARQARS